MQRDDSVRRSVFLNRRKRPTRHSNRTARQYRREQYHGAAARESGEVQVGPEVSEHQIFWISSWNRDPCSRRVGTSAQSNKNITFCALLKDKTHGTRPVAGSMRDREQTKCRVSHWFYLARHRRSGRMIRKHPISPSYSLLWAANALPLRGSIAAHVAALRSQRFPVVPLSAV